MGRVAIMCLKVMVVVVAMLQLSAACRRRSKQATCTYDRFKHCAECPVPPLQCAACGRDKVMSSDKQKCLVCPSNCQTCVYNNEKTRAECATCNDGYALNSANTMCTAVSGCDGSAAVLTAEEGTFGINKTQYKDYMKCGWIIIVDTSQIIKLAFITFSVEYSNDCDYDNVRVHDGMGDSAKLLGKYCGTTIPSDIISSNDHLFVSFKTDKTVTEAGFKIRYSAIHRICSPNCDSCASNGAGKCDASHCHARYALDPTSNTCQACSGNCHTCARPGICNSNGCDPQYTLNTTTDTCTVCPVNCEKCSYNARQDKIECDICISRLAVNVMKTCSACAAHCKVCSVSGPGKCDPRQCDDAYKFFYSTTTCGVCAPNCLGCTRPGQCDSDKCSNGYVFNVNDSTCIACAAHCRKCVATGGGFCDSGNCATGYTLDAMGKICTPCASDCMVCNTKGPGKCDKGQCSRRYARNPSTDTCVACPSDCEVCSFNPSRSRTECKECFGPRGVSSGESCSACAEFCHLCFENGAEKCDPNQCFVGYTLDAANTCTECPPDCATCRYTDDKTECTHCYGSFGVAEDKTCAACDPNCDGCANNGAGKCDSNQCNDRYIFDDASKTCKPCPRHCSTCKYVNNAAECRKCDDLFGIKADNKTCGACSSNCDGCATSGAGKCDSGKCHNHYALDGVTETCKPCSGGLENCNDCSYNAFVCVSCVSPFELNSTNQCSGETANVLHGGPLMTVYATTASVVVYLVTGLVV